MTRIHCQLLSRAFIDLIHISYTSHFTLHILSEQTVLLVLHFKVVAQLLRVALELLLVVVGIQAIIHYRQHRNIK